MEKGEGDIKWRRTRLYKDLGAFGSATSIQAKPDLPRIQALKIGKRDGSRSSSESGRSKRERDEEEDLQARKRSWPAAKRLPFDALDESIMIIDSDSEADVGRPTRRPMRPRPTKTRAPPPPESEMEGEEEEISEDMPQRASRATDRLNEQISATSGSAHPGAAPNGTSGYSVRPTTLADKHDANVDEYELVHLQPHATDAEIWSCPACPYKVLDAQETSGQREIADHRLGHENNVLEQVMTLDAEELQLQASTK